MVSLTSLTFDHEPVTLTSEMCPSKCSACIKDSHLKIDVLPHYMYHILRFCNMAYLSILDISLGAVN